MTASVSSDKQDKHEDDKCKIVLMSPISCIIYYNTCLIFSTC